MTVHVFPPEIAEAGHRALAASVADLLDDRGPEVLQIVAVGAELLSLDEADLHGRLSNMLDGGGHELLCDMMRALRILKNDLDAMTRCATAVRSRLVSALQTIGAEA